MVLLTSNNARSIEVCCVEGDRSRGGQLVRALKRRDYGQTA
jgi:hypothetical protein